MAHTHIRETLNNRGENNANSTFHKNPTKCYKPWSIPLPNCRDECTIMLKAFIRVRPLQMTEKLLDIGKKNSC